MTSNGDFLGLVIFINYLTIVIFIILINPFNYMSMDNLLISTGIDALIKLVHERKKVELEEAATLLGLPISTVEDWASILESQGIIRIEYQFTREYLVWTGKSDEELIKQLGNVEENISRLSAEVDTLLARIKHDTEDLQLSQKKLKTFFKSFDKKYSMLVRRLKKLREIDAQVRSITEEPTSEISKLRDELSKLMGRLSELEHEFQTLKEGLSEFESSHGSLGDVLKLRRNIEKKINLMVNRFSDLEGRLASIDQQISHLNELADTLKKASDLLNELVILKHGLENKVHDLVVARDELTQFASKWNATDVSDMIDKLQSRLDGLSGSLDEIKEQISLIEKDKAKVEHELIRLSKEYDRIKRLGIDNLIERVETDMNRIDSLISEFNEIQSLLKDPNKLKTEVDAIKRELTNFYGELTKLKSDFSLTVESVMKELDEMTDEISPLLNQYNILKKGLDTYLRSFNIYRSSLERAMSDLDEKQTELDKLLDERYQPLKKDLDELSSLFDEYKDIREIYPKLLEFSETIDSLLQDMDGLEKRLLLLKKKIDLLHSLKGEELTTQMAEVHSTLEDVKEDFKRVNLKKSKLMDMISKMNED